MLDDADNYDAEGIDWMRNYVESMEPFTFQLDREGGFKKR